MKSIIIPICLSLAVVTAVAAPRSRSEVNLFKRTHICPATHTTLKSRQSCKGYIIDHIIALCDGGPDKASNMQYMTIAASKAKDRTECHTKR